MDRVRRGWSVAMTLAVIAPAALAGCGADKEAPRFVSGQVASASPTPPPEPFEFAISPEADAKDLPISTEIGTSVSGGEVTSVTLVEDGGGEVSGSMRDDGTSWVPDKPLKNNKKYTATVVATSASGDEETKTTTFSTMGKSGSQTGTGLYLFDGRTYGVAMPVVVEFFPGVPEKERANVQKRMFVSTDPPQPGTWYWVANGSQAFYRAPDYWQPGTKLTARIALGGHPTGDGRYGDQDRGATATIGGKVTMEVDNATKQLSMFKDDKLVKQMPVSLGKPSTPSSSGTMVVMDKQAQTVFDTFAELGPEEGYRTDISFAQRITWGGEFIHAAPWSVGDQGVRNVSHGCVNLSMANAEWLFSQTKVGDPITVKGTERKLADGNGWTAWNLTWDEFVKGSALPVPADLAPKQRSGSPAPAQSGGGTPTPAPSVTSG
ncbi:Ig-like domain-containing protein [Solwaraspora sp. WMMD791]|uniref:L,D-transpeptidase n=1 Tax=Solwaraspora sp. WMMD791 TaxID=3016086 RepID=UPI00249C631B|nr:Ig-like domain-containing protein [Solwaraspora sp. WMMD791]WFE27071.1 Ig-like domain-containing protein [Solwaraspora sp. WMMD791]